METQEERAEKSTGERMERLNALGMSLSRTRTEAITGRQATGIEMVWTEDEEHCEGIDDLNRGQVGNWNSKPPGQAYPKGQGNQSTEFPNITGPYVDAAAAKIGGILLPTDDRSWGLTETPVPEILQQKAAGTLPMEVLHGLAEINASEQQALAVAAEEAKAAQAMILEARAKAEKAQKRIEDWHVEGQWHAEVRKVIEDACRIGSGVLKGPVPVSKRALMYRDGALVVQNEIKPVSKRIDPWNFYPDPACGESIHNGNYTWERDFLTAKQLRALKNDPDYIASQIDLCLNEGPKKASDVRKMADGREIGDKDIYEIWYYHGQAEREDLEAAGCKCKEGVVSIPAIFTMVNDRVIKGALNPLDTGDFPYDVMPFKRRKNMPWGTGVSRLIRTPQRIVTAGTRVMMTNGGRAAGPIFILKNNVEGADGNNDILPWKQFYAPEDTADVRSAVAMIEIPDRFNSLSGIVQFGMMLAERVTGLPLLLQGQLGDAPDTLGGQQMANANASETLRRVALIFDDCVTEPHIRRYYAWLLQYGKDDEKGEFVIDARGSTDLVARDIYKNELQGQLLQASLNPAFDLSPAKVMEEYLRVSKKKPENFKLTDEEKAAQAQAQAQAQGQAPPDNSLAVAKVKAESEEAERKFKAAEADKNRKHEAAMKAMEREVAILNMSNNRNISLDKIKAMLGGKTMDLKVQKELAGGNGKGPQVAKPAVEPPGRAPDGRAFPQ